MRLIVTGYNGFIGQEIAKSQNFLRKYEVIPCKDINKLPIILNQDPNSILLHLAGLFSGEKKALWSANVELVSKVMDQLKEASSKARLIYLSTGAVYGQKIEDPPALETDKTNPTNFYGLTKLKAEQIILNSMSNKNKKFHILRLPNVYGKNQKKGVIYNMKNQIQNSSIVQISGDGNQQRDFLHVSDLLTALDLVLSYEGESEIFNISSDLCLSINDLAKILINHKSVNFEYIEDTNGLEKLVLNYNKAKKILGFKPKVNDLNLE